MALVQSLIDSSKYGVKCPYDMSPKGICVHNTANDATAKNEVAYMKSNNNEVSFHIAIDDVEAIQAIPFNRNAWAAGDGGSGNGNRNYIHIEICYSKSGGDKFIAAEKRAAKEIAALLKSFGWTISNMKKHQDFSGKYCPHRTLDMGWQRFVNMVQAELDALNKPATTTTTSTSASEIYRVRKTWADAKSQIGAYSNLDNAKKNCPSGYAVFDSKGNQVYPAVAASTPAATPAEVYRVRKTWADASSQKGAYSNLDNAKKECDKYEGYHVFNSKGVSVYYNAPKVVGTSYAEKGVFTFNTAVKIRTAPSTASKYETGLCYYAGESVTYHTVHLNKDGRNWIQYTRGNGTEGYCPVRDLTTGESYGTAK